MKITYEEVKRKNIRLLTRPTTGLVVLFFDNSTFKGLVINVGSSGRTQGDFCEFKDRFDKSLWVETNGIVTIEV